MYEKNIPITNQELFSKTLEDVFKQILREQMDALNMLTRTIVEIVLPLPTRISMWLAEQNIDKNDPNDIIKHMGSIISLEQAKLLAENHFKFDRDGKLHKAFCENMKISSKKIKGSLKKLIDIQKEIINELKLMNKAFAQNVLINTTPYLLEIMTKIMTQLIKKQEVREYGIKHLLDNLTLENGQSAGSTHA